ncbi:MAG: VCBS repeat-containing protein [Acidimicrobiales bacterium]|nr:VCBS repeat-containing protein [Acidimicrobiales bacterium]
MLRPPSALRTLAAVLIVTGATSVGSVAMPTSAPASPAGRQADGLSAQAPEAPTPPSPLVGDFDGDGRADQLWYGPGGSPDHAWYGKANRGFAGRAVTVGGTYVPLIGDFGGDGRDDVLWYGPGGAADYLWQGTAGRGFVGRSVSVAGVYVPLVGDFDGDRRSDVLWYSASGPDRLWYGTASGFTAVPVAVTRQYTPVLGDFDGNGTTDILWYGPGTAGDYLWRGTWTRRFVGASIKVNGTYTPVVGDFGGDGPQDVYWDGQAGSGVLWSGRRSGGFEGATTATVGAAVPVAGDYDGDGADDLVWDNAGVASDRVWYGSPGGFAPRAVKVGGTYAARPGDYDGDGRDDLFWYAAGAARDALWFAGPGRAFAARPAILDPLPGADAPFRQDTWATQYDPYGYMAHAFGPTPPDQYGRQFGYSNSLEAFEHNFARGFRVFEADWVRLADGTVLAAHNGTERRYGLPPGVTFDEATRGQLDATYTVGGGNGNEASTFTPVFAADLVELLRTPAYADAYVILDTKFDHVEIVAEFVRLTAGRPDLMDRLVPHVEGQAELDRLRAIYPIRNYVLALYRTQAWNRFDDPEVVRFVRNNRTPAVMMWWNTRNRALSLSANMAQQRRYTPTFAAQLEASGAVVYVHSLSDTDIISTFASRRVGVYSNGPFPPFTTEPAPIEPRIESGPLV